MAGILGLQNQWEKPPECGNERIETYLKTVAPKMLAISQSRNYDEVPVQSVCLCILHDFHNCFQFFVIFCSSKKG